MLYSVCSTGFHKAPFQYLHDSCCYKQIQLVVSCDPNHQYNLTHRLSAYPLKSGWFFLIDHLTEGEKLYWNVTLYPLQLETHAKTWKQTCCHSLWTLCSWLANFYTSLPCKKIVNLLATRLANQIDETGLIYSRSWNVPLVGLLYHG